MTSYSAFLLQRFGKLLQTAAKIKSVEDKNCEPASLVADFWIITHISAISYIFLTVYKAHVLIKGKAVRDIRLTMCTFSRYFLLLLTNSSSLLSFCISRKKLLHDKVRVYIYLKFSFDQFSTASARHQRENPLEEDIWTWHTEEKWDNVEHSFIYKAVQKMNEWGKATSILLIKLAFPWKTATLLTSWFSGILFRLSVFPYG